MTRTREWLESFTPEILSDLRAAARAYHAEIDDCDPERCAHPEPMMMPVDLPNWIEQQLHAKRRAPLHLRPAGQPHRRRRDPRLEVNLAAAG